MFIYRCIFICTDICVNDDLIKSKTISILSIKNLRDSDFCHLLVTWQCIEIILENLCKTFYREHLCCRIYLFYMWVQIFVSWHNYVSIILVIQKKCTQTKDCRWDKTKQINIILFSWLPVGSQCFLHWQLQKTLRAKNIWMKCSWAIFNKAFSGKKQPSLLVNVGSLTLAMRVYVSDYDENQTQSFKDCIVTSLLLQKKSASWKW